MNHCASSSFVFIVGSSHLLLLFCDVMRFFFARNEVGDATVQETASESVCNRIKDAYRSAAIHLAELIYPLGTSVARPAS